MGRLRKLCVPIVIVILLSASLDASQIAYSDNDNVGIQINSLDGSLLHQFSAGGQSILDFGFDFSGNVIALTDTGLWQFNSDGTTEGYSRPSLVAGNGIWGTESKMAVGPGQIAYSDNDNVGIQTNSLDGSLLNQFSAGGDLIVDFGFDYSGNVIVLTDTGLVQFNSDSPAQGLSRPTMVAGNSLWGTESRMAVGPGGQLAFSDNDNIGVQTNSLDGTLLHQFSAGGQPILDFGFDYSGNVIALTDTGLWQFNSDGTTSELPRPPMFAGNGAWGTDSRMAVTPVPEPSSIAQWFVAILMLLFATRRRFQ